MKPLLFNIFMAFTWISLTGEFTPANFVIGLVLGFFLLRAFRQTLLPETSYFRKLGQVAQFITFFLREIVLANLRVAYEVITPEHHMHPAIIAIPLDVKSELEITLLANLITLTPGTLTLDISSDMKTIYVHSMYVDDVEEFRQSIKQGFEKRVRELLE